MKSDLKKIGGFIVMICFSSCVEKRNQNTVSPLYFDLVSLIEKESAKLDSIQPTITKEFRIEGRSETRSFSKVDWQNELEIFKQADINSPVLRGKYIVEKEEKKVIYRPKELPQKGVTALNIELDEAGNLKEVSGTISSRSILYSFQRNLVLTFKQYKGTLLLTKYNIYNEESLIFRKKEVNTLDVTVNLP